MIREPEDEISAFCRRLEVRLRKGAEEYGDASFDRPFPETAEEMLEEALDIAGWAFVWHEKLRRRLLRMQRGAHIWFNVERCV